MTAYAPSPLIAAPPSVQGRLLRQPPGHIPREALLQRLLAYDCRLRLLIAPAGFGKSVLLADCAHQCPPDHELLWLNCAVPGLDPAQLCQLLCQALGYAPSLSSSELLAALAQEPRRLWLVLNDYPVAPADELDGYLNLLLNAAAAGICWWLGSRRRPACNLPRLLLEGELLELGPSDLLFSAAEVSAS